MPGNEDPEAQGNRGRRLTRGKSDLAIVFLPDANCVSSAASGRAR